MVQLDIETLKKNFRFESLAVSSMRNWDEKRNRKAYIKALL